MTAPTPNAPAGERADGSTPIRRAIAEVLQAAALHMIASPECAQAVDRVVELHLAARREVEALRTALARVIASDGPGCVCKACTTARAALAATPEEKND